jgi:hypothetical protein
MRCRLGLDSIKNSGNFWESLLLAKPIALLYLIYSFFLLSMPFTKRAYFCRSAQNIRNRQRWAVAGFLLDATI